MLRQSEPRPLLALPTDPFDNKQHLKHWKQHENNTGWFSSLSTSFNYAFNLVISCHRCFVSPFASILSLPLYL
jgi:hypothetical protein